MTKNSLRYAIATCLLALSGCGGLLGGGGTAYLYRFGAGPMAAEAPNGPDIARRVPISYPGSSFQHSTQWDRILAVTGVQTGYIEDARWVSPAKLLFDAAVIHGMKQAAPGIRIVRVGNSPPADYILEVDVRHFEARYLHGAKAAPDVVLDVHVTLVRRSDRSVVDGWSIAESEAATENRVTAIVEAFDRATTSVVRQIAEHTWQRLANG